MTAAFLSWDTSDLPGPDTVPGRYRVGLWHGKECAICGDSPGRLVVDHDHVTHLTRGMLCLSCNNVEGRGYDGVYADWRNGVNPGAMYGLAEEYWSAFSAWEHLPTPTAETMRRGAEACGIIGDLPDTF